MSPDTGRTHNAWLDPTSVYMNAVVLHDLLDDLITDLQGVAFDVVAGCDAMGFVLAAGLATRKGIGFLPVRKAGKLCVATDHVAFTNYSGRAQKMEMRLPAFAPGTRVLIADQWIQTGGTMLAAIALVERQQGVMAGLATIAIKTCTATDEFARRFPIAMAVMPGCRRQEEGDAQTLAGFGRCDAARTFPDAGRSIG